MGVCTVRFIRVPYYTGDPKRAPTLENYPYKGLHDLGVDPKKTLNPSMKPLALPCCIHCGKLPGAVNVGSQHKNPSSGMSPERTFFKHVHKMVTAA